VVTGKPPVWRPFVSPSPKTDSGPSIVPKRSPRSYSTEPVAKCSRVEQVSTTETYDRILSSIRILVRGLHSDVLHYQTKSVQQHEEELNLDGEHTVPPLRRIQNNLLEYCRTRLVRVNWEEYPLFKDLDWSVA
jgi:hypothetical protein